jgi:adenylosuccinate lyase
MRAWQEKIGFLHLLEADSRVTAHLSKNELVSLFNYDQYLKHVDDIFKRLKLITPREIPQKDTEEAPIVSW